MSTYVGRKTIVRSLPSLIFQSSVRNVMTRIGSIERLECSKASKKTPELATGGFCVKAATLFGTSTAVVMNYLHVYRKCPKNETIFKPAAMSANEN